MVYRLREADPRIPDIFLRNLTHVLFENRTRRLSRLSP